MKQRCVLTPTCFVHHFPTALLEASQEIPNSDTKVGFRIDEMLSKFHRFDASTKWHTIYSRELLIAEEYALMAMMTCNLSQNVLPRNVGNLVSPYT